MAINVHHIPHSTYYARLQGRMVLFCDTHVFPNATCFPIASVPLHGLCFPHLHCTPTGSASLSGSARLSCRGRCSTSLLGAFSKPLPIPGHVQTHWLLSFSVLTFLLILITFLYMLSLLVFFLGLRPPEDRAAFSVSQAWHIGVLVEGTNDESVLSPGLSKVLGCSVYALRDPFLQNPRRMVI